MRFIFLTFTLALCSCDESGQEKPVQMTQDSPIKAEQIESVSSKKIYFGHMSVGYNIIDGMKTVIEKSGALESLKFIETEDLKNVDEPGFYHHKIGQNGSPEGKIRNFKNHLAKGVGESFDIALLKFCYADIKKHTDVEALFETYTKAVDEIENQYPNLTLVHVTAPYKVHSPSIKQWVKNLLKGDQDNIKRNQYNQMLLKQYGSKHVFDLAKVESTRSDGSEATFKYKGNIYHSLIPEYSYDGGHLNAKGKVKAGSELLKVLGRVAADLPTNP